MPEYDAMMVAVVVLFKAIIAFPVAWLFAGKGYGYGRFYLIGLLLDPISCFALYLLMPRICSKREASRLRKGVS